MFALIRYDRETGTVVGLDEMPDMKVVLRRGGEIVYVTPGMEVEPGDELSAIQVDITGPQP